MTLIPGYQDPALRARVVRSIPLLYADGAYAALDRPAHVRAGSGIAWIGGLLAVVQDDANFIALVDPASYDVRALTLPAGEGGVRLFGSDRGNKQLKLDLEACVALPDGPGGEMLVAFGSGSTPQRERIVLVDTPGVNDLSLQRADITYSYIPRSDAVLFLLDAGQPLKESERVFLQEKLLAQSRDKIIFVVTKRDIWDGDEEAEALSYIRGELAKLVKTPVVFPVSAERRLEGREGESGMPEMLGHLTSFLAEERGRILLDNALGEGIEGGKLLRKGVDARRRAVHMTREELGRRPYVRRARDGKVSLRFGPGGRCRHLQADRRCAIYELRPFNCSVFLMGSEACLVAREETLGLRDGAPREP